jgi:RES domain-containing protein
VLYCASSESLALLELRVHSPQPYPRTRWRFAIEVPDDALALAAKEELPRGWNKLPPGPASKRFGDAWVAAGSGLGLLVPSVVASEENNLILNPTHPRFQEVRVLSKLRVVLDRRLYSPPAKRRSSTQGKKKR